MQLEVLRRFARVFIGIAVLAAVRARVVGADVAALYAVAAVPHALVLERAELHAVRCAQNIERHAPRRANAIARKVAVGSACLQVDAVLGGDFAHATRQLVHALFGEHHQLGHVVFDLLVYLHEAEDAAIDMRRQRARHAIERFQVMLHGVRFGEQHGVVTPSHALRTHDARQLDECLHALVDGWYAWLDVAPVSGDGVVAVAVEAVGYFMQARQDGAVVLRAEHHAVDHIGRKFQA